MTERLDIDRGAALTLGAVNLEPLVDGADLGLPDPVSTAVSANYSDWETASLERIAPKGGTSVATLREKLDTAETRYPTHGVALRGPNGGLQFNVSLGVDQRQPIQRTVRFDTPGSYDFTCTGYCGFGHTYMTLSDAIVVT
ncbi:MAG: hypothetical protein ABEJ94_06335 [Halorientalis sp.]